MAFLAALFGGGGAGAAAGAGAGAGAGATVGGLSGLGGVSALTTSGLNLLGSSPLAGGSLVSGTVVGPGTAVGGGAAAGGGTAAASTGFLGMNTQELIENAIQLDQSIAGGIRSFSAAKDAGDKEKEAERKGLEAAALERKKGRIRKGQQRAAFASSGALVSFGTPLDVFADTAAAAEMNAVRVTLAFEEQERIFRRKKLSAISSGVSGVGSTILGSFSGE